MIIILYLFFALIIKNIKFGELLTEWMQLYKTTVKPSTYSRTKGHVKNHIRPYFGGMLVNKISLQHCQAFTNKIFNLMPAGAPIVTGIVKRVLDYAIRLGLRDNNPMQYVIRPKHQASIQDLNKHPNFYDRKELAKFLSTAKELSLKHYALFRLLAYSGIRTGELIALTWQDLNFKTKELAKITKFQNANGSFSWFPGGQDDDYLTLYALNSFAQALAYGADIPQTAAQKAFSYIVPRIEKRLQDDKTGSESAVAYALYAAYTLSAFPQNWAQMSQAKPYIKRWADYADQQARFMTALGQIYAAAVYHRLGDDVKANRYLDLVLSRMKQNELTGAYFAPEPQSWVWYRDTISTQTVTLRTLLELRPQSDKIDPLTQWLLFNRQVNSWSDPKAAAQGVFTLLDVMKHKGALSLPVSYTVRWAGEEKNFSFEPFDWTEDLQLVRQGRQITPQALQAQIEKKGVLTDFASLSVIYKSAEAKESPKGVLNVTRKYFSRFTQDGIQKIRPVQNPPDLKATGC